MTKADLDFALGLTSKEGWSSTKTDFEELLAFDAHGCFIGEENREKVGMVCAITYGEFGTIGNLIVIDEYRGRGLGAMLMEHAMSYLCRIGALEMYLDGVQAAVSLYERLGFKKICRSLRLSGIIAGKSSRKVRPMRELDFDEVLAIDRKHFKADRSFFLKSCHEKNPRLCKVLEVDNKIAGYILGSPRERSARIGPWVMDSHLNKAVELVKSFAVETENQMIQLGVLESNVPAVQLIKKIGFTETSYSWRMARGKPESIEFSKGLYSIHSPARG